MGPMWTTPRDPALEELFLGESGIYISVNPIYLEKKINGPIIVPTPGWGMRMYVSVHV